MRNLKDPRELFKLKEFDSLASRMKECKTADEFMKIPEAAEMMKKWKIPEKLMRDKFPAVKATFERLDREKNHS